MRNRALLLSVVASLVVVSCGGEKSGTTAPTAFHAVTADAKVVTGTAACEFYQGADGIAVECELDMSDPRVSGTETIDQIRYVARGRDGTAWVAERDVITNAMGTWRGTAQAAQDPEGIPCGEAHFVGEGAYEGLEFHYYFFHGDLDDKADLRGWISDAA